MANLDNDPQFLMDLFNKMMNMVDDAIKKRPDFMDLKEREFMTIMKNYIAQGNNPYSAQIEKEHALELAALCKEKNIPFTILGSSGDKKLFFIKQENAQEFQKLSETISMRDPKYAAKVSASQIALNLTNNAQNQGYVIKPIFDGNYSTFPEIIKTKLYDNGISASNTNEAICLSACSEFNKTGYDLNAFQLDMTVKNTYLFQGHSFLPNSTEYAKTYFDQKMYDDSELQKFIKEAAAGKAVILCDAFNPDSKKYIKFNKETNNFEINGVENLTDTIKIPFKGSKEEIKTMLFKYSDSIHNMTTVDPATFKQLKNKNLSEKELQRICSRPKLDSNLEYVRASELQATELVRKINKIASEEIVLSTGFDRMSNQEKYLKKQEIIKGIFDGTYKNEEAQKTIEKFINSDDMIFGENASQAHDNILSKIQENFKNGNKNLYSIEQMNTKEISLTKDSKTFVKEKEKELTNRINVLEETKKELKSKIKDNNKSLSYEERSTKVMDLINSSNLPKTLKDKLNAEPDKTIVVLNNIRTSASVPTPVKEEGSKLFNEITENIYKEEPYSAEEIEAFEEAVMAINAEEKTIKYQLEENNKYFKEIEDKDFNFTEEETDLSVTE